MAVPNRPRTPLRRVSQGSLSALARSGNVPPGSTGLEFLAPALVELADEAQTLLTTVEGLNALSDSLDTFNEAFASYLFVMKMNSLCVEWPEAPTAQSFRDRVYEFEHAQRLVQSTIVAPRSPTPSDIGPEPSYAVPSAPPAEPSPQPHPLPGRKSSIPPVAKALPRKGAPKPKMTVKEKKAREAWIEKLVNYAPMEFRGRDPALRSAAEAVLNGLIEAQGHVRPADLVKPPVLPPVMVNKCLMAFVGGKVVNKTTSNGMAMYSLSDMALSHRNP